MDRYLRPHLRGFDPSIIQILTVAFDNAWQAVQNSGASYATRDRAGSARAELAKYIIDQAVLGERNPRALTDGAYIASLLLCLEPFGMERCQNPT